MKYALPILCRWLHSLFLALWIGGLIAIGALVAPTAFHFVRSSPALAGQISAQTALAGGIVGGSLRLFNILCYVCGALMIVTDIGLMIAEKLRGRRRLLTTASSLVTLLLLGSAFYLGLGLFPALDLAQAQNNMALFDQLHHRYESLSSAQLLPLLLIIFLTAWRDTPPQSSDAISQPIASGKHLTPEGDSLLRR